MTNGNTPVRLALGDSPLTTFHPSDLLRLDPDRLRAYQQHLDFYRGAQWQARPRRGETHLTFNYAKAFVDKVTSYLMSDLNFAVEPADASPEAAERARRAEDALYQTYEANDLQQLDFDTELDTAILGDGCFKLTWDPAERQVRITAPDIQGLFAWWQPDDQSRLWRVASRYTLPADDAASLYALPTTRQQHTLVEVWTDASFQLWLGDSLYDERPNPYGFIPFLIFPNLREPKQFWGTSDLAPLLEPARELNRSLSQLSKILELSGNPIAVLENVEEAQDIAVQPGAVWEIPERAKAYLLDLLQGGGVNLHIDYINLLYRALHDLAETPRTSFGDNQQGLSGIALEMELHPLLQKVKRKRIIRTAMYRRRCQLILRLLEQHTGERYLPARIRIIWGPVLPQDRSRLVADEEVLVRAGIHSHRRAMDELGIQDPDAEWQRVREEQTPEA